MIKKVSSGVKINSKAFKITVFKDIGHFFCLFSLLLAIFKSLEKFTKSIKGAQSQPKFFKKNSM